MNKNTKIKVNYVLGGAVSVALLALIYLQVQKQFSGLNAEAWRHTGSPIFLLACLVLMVVNMLLESLKWYRLVLWTGPVSFARAVASYLAGVSFGLVTPNRVGEYPGRVMYLRTGSAMKYLGVSLAGVLSQLGGVYTIGLIGLIYYGTTHGGVQVGVAMAYCVAILVLLTVVYWRMESWITVLSRVRWLRKMPVLGRLIGKAPVRERAVILTLSIVRSMVFTAQFLFLLRWMNVEVPLAEGFCISALFFWVVAVIPSLAFTELGVRGAAGIFLFGQYTGNTVGILAATTGMWLLNIVLPAIPGSILAIKMKWLR